MLEPEDLSDRSRLGRIGHCAVPVGAKNALIEGKPLLATRYYSQRLVEELDDMMLEVEPSESHYDKRKSVHKCPLCNTEINSIRFVRPDATMAGLIQ